jgi:mRNA interferase RelE/StbE
MAFVLVLKPSARKALDSLAVVDRAKMLLVLESIERDPYGGKKLQGDLHRQYSVRAWPYRIVYEIFKRELIIIVIKIGHRQGVYKK